MKIATLAISALLLLASCGGDDGAPPTVPTAPTPTPTPTPTPRPVAGVTKEAAIATFVSPWALAMLPDGRFLVTQRVNGGALSVVSPAGQIIAVMGLPANIGLLDVKLGADFAANGTLFFSYMERDVNAPRVGRGAADPALFPERMRVARAQLATSGTTAQLQNVAPIYAQEPFITTFTGSGEPGGRIALSPNHVFITSGDRQELDRILLFGLDNDLGKTIRLNLDGSVPADNPFINTPGARPGIWSFGHRNHYGLAFAADGRLWSSEMGPKGGDEFNLVTRGLNYGWPAVSNGNQYDGSDIPDHAPGDGFEAPKFSWTPVIAPAGMIFYSGRLFEDWTGDAILAGLQSKGLVRVRVTGNAATEVQRIDLGERARDVVQAADGSIWVLSDGTAGKLYRVTPTF